MSISVRWRWVGGRGGRAGRWARLAARCAASLGLALLLIATGGPAASPAPLAAQAGQSQEEIRDSLQNVVRERLERLTRRLGDTTGLLPVDSVDDNLDDVSTTDSTLLSLLALPGYDLIQYRGDAATFATRDRLLTLYGSSGSEAVMNREGLELTADSALVFNERTGRLVTMGEEAIYRPEQGEEVVTRRIIFDLNEDRGTATDVRSQSNTGMGNWIVRGDFPSVSAHASFGHDIMFTSCPDDEPHYHFVAREIKMQDGTMVARNVLLYFGDVGVMWLPFIAQSTNNERRSGLLPIRFSVNDIVRTSGSYARRLSNIGFYWAINDYVDAQASMDWWSGNYTAITGAAQFNWLRQFMDSRVSFRQFWRNEGGSELAFDAGYNWEISERTQLRLSGRYASSAAFVRRNSFDPREITQSIDSDGGLNRRFDWGTLSVSANRRQFLSDDRVESTFPTANLSLSTITLFEAPPNRARFYNNATVSASGRFSRSIRDLGPQDLSEEPFSFSMADSENWRGGLSTSLSLGRFSVSQSVELNRDLTRGIPAGFFDPEAPAQRAGIGTVADLQRSIVVPHAASVFGAQSGRAAQSGQAGDPSDFSAENLTWSTSVNYQQNLVGSTTITPTLSVSGRGIRSDTASVGEGGFVSAPNRISFGAQLSSDIYGFFMGGRLRHKLSPTFDYSYSPEVTPDAVQAATFGDRAIVPRNEIRFGLTQTFEMRVDDEEDEEGGGDGSEDGQGDGQGDGDQDGDGGEDGDGGDAGDGGDGGDEADPMETRIQADPDGGPGRLPRSEKVTVLALRSSAVTYDFEQASELGHFTRGFADNLRMSHQISSDYLRGLSISLEHLVFDETAVADGPGRTFSPFISNVNLDFSMGNETALFQWLGDLLGGRDDEDEGDDEGAGEGGEDGEGRDEGDPDAEGEAIGLDEEGTADPTDRDPAALEPEQEAAVAPEVPGPVAPQPTVPELDPEVIEDPAGFDDEDLGESTIVPGGSGRDRSRGRQRATRGGVGSWNANISYSLARNRGVGAGNQMVQASVNFQPTENWALSWRTSYDVAASAFNDHMISLTRNLHRWEADFSFRQTATGNWTFLFEVALTDNRDLHFDYEQRTGGDVGRFAPGG